MLKDLVGDDGRVGRKIAAIERNIDRASRIARELLHFSREKEAALEPISINQVLTSALNLLQHQQLSSIVHLNLRDVPAVMGIPWKLEEVFVNLLMNSLDACGEGNRIEVTTSCAANRVVVVSPTPVMVSTRSNWARCSIRFSPPGKSARAQAWGFRCVII